MKLVRAYKTELAPDDAQLASLYRHAGAARFAYNWGLEWKSNVHLFNLLPHPRLKTPSAVDLHRELTRLKKGKLSWLYEVSKCAPQEALRDLDAAFSNFFGHRTGFPNFKSRKKRGVGSFTLYGAIRVRPGEVRLPRIGWVRLKERGYIPSRAHIKSVTVSERAKRWYVAVNVVVEERKELLPPHGPLVGVDRGLNSLAVISDGTVLENPRALRRYERKLRHLQRNLSRKRKGSSNRRKAREALARLNLRVRNTRLDAIQKFTTMLAKIKPVIVVEDLDVKNMMGNHHLARAIADAAWGEISRQLLYKTRWYGSTLITADRWYPSTKRCSRCGHMKDGGLPIEERVFHCEACSLVADRDLNAARNLAEWPGVARTLEMPVEGGVQSTAEPLIQPPGESGTISLGRGPRRWMS